MGEYITEVEGLCTLAAKQDSLSSADMRGTQRIPPGGTPGYIIGTLRAGWRSNRHLSLTAAVKSVSDEDYRIYGSGLNEPGRNAVITADIRF